MFMGPRRQFVSGKVLSLAMSDSGYGMCVRSQIVKFSGMGVRTLWHKLPLD
jgi:hypothetical protein